MKKTAWPVIFCITALLLMPGQINGQKKKSHDKTKSNEKIEPRKNEPKLELVERIRMVLKYGNVAQVRDGLTKIAALKEDEQKTLIPEIKDLLASKDASLQPALIQTIGDVKWNDLDSSVIGLLESEDPQVFSMAANVIRKKAIRDAIEPIKAKLLKADYTATDNRINDLLNAFSVFKDSSLQDFMFQKLKEDNVLGSYKSFIMKYLGTLDGAQAEINQYLLDLANNEKADINMRINAVRVLGNKNVSEAREPLKKKLEEIEAISDLSKKKEMFNLRLELISALVKLKDPDVKTLLIQMSRDDDESLRIRAIRRLSEFKSAEFTDLLEYKMKYDSSPAVQKEAKKALDIIRGQKESGDEPQ